MICFSWFAAFLPLIPSFFGFYGDHGLECQTRQCKILSDGEHGHVKRRFELFLHVCWAVLLVAANVGLFLRYWVKTAKISYWIKMVEINTVRLPLSPLYSFKLRFRAPLAEAGLALQEQDKKVTRVVLAVVVVFFLTYLPNFILRTVSNFI